MTVKQTMTRIIVCDVCDKGISRESYNGGAGRLPDPVSVYALVLHGRTYDLCQACAQPLIEAMQGGEKTFDILKGYGYKQDVFRNWSWEG
jgi:hypothetical protein